MGWQWHQLDHMQIICTSLQTDNHASTSPLSFYRPDALPATKPTVSKHWRQRYWCRLLQAGCPSYYPVNSMKEANWQHWPQPGKAPSPPVHIFWAMMIVWRTRENYQNCSVLRCIRQLYTVIRTHVRAVRKDECWFRLFSFVHLFRFSILCFLLV